jgi:hypothetical protein
MGVNLSDYFPVEVWKERKKCWMCGENLHIRKLVHIRQEKPDLYDTGCQRCVQDGLPIEAGPYLSLSVLRHEMYEVKEVSQ